MHSKNAIAKMRTWDRGRFVFTAPLTSKHTPPRTRGTGGGLAIAEAETEAEAEAEAETHARTHTHAARSLQRTHHRGGSPHIKKSTHTHADRRGSSAVIHSIVLQGRVQVSAAQRRLASHGRGARVCGDACPRTKKSGNVFRVGIFLDFVWLTTRTMHPHVGPQHVRGARRNRIVPHGGGIERLAARTCELVAHLLCHQRGAVPVECYQ